MSCPEAMVLRIWRFWKTRHLGVDFGPCRHTVGLSAIEVDIWSWGPTMMLRIWGPTMVLRIWDPTMVLRSWGPTKLLRNWDWTSKCAERWGVVSIVWYERLLRIVCLSPRVEEPKSEINKRFVPEQQKVRLSFIASGRSSGLHPVSSHSCWMYVRAGRPAFARPYAGVHRSTSLMSSSLLLQQCHACLVHLTWIVFVMEAGGRIVGALWSVAARTCSMLLATFLCNCHLASSPAV